MKTFLLFLLMPLLLSSPGFTMNNSSNMPDDLTGSTRIYCSADLLDITRLWVDDFKAVYPNVEIKIVLVTDASLDWVLNNSESLSIVSSNYVKPSSEGHPWNILIGRDVLVPIVNSNNPYIEYLLENGMSPEEIKRFITQPEQRSWSSLIPHGSDLPVNYYSVEEGSARILLANFLEIAEQGINGVAVNDEQALVAAVREDPMAIGFCSYKSTLNPLTYNVFEDINLLPIDKNGNGKIDYIEHIYSDRDELMRGAWVGKHPAALVNRIYAIAKMKPSTDLDLAFLKWIISDGQEKLSMTGYGVLSLHERLTKMNVVETTEIDFTTSDIQYAYSKKTILILSSFVVVLIIGIALFRRYRSKRFTEKQANAVPEFVFDDNKLVAPAGLFYGKSHTWAFMEQDGIVKIGIDDFLQHITGPITAIKLKNEGEKVCRGEYVLSIVQQGKQISLYSPVSGTIEKQNTALKKDPYMINNSPYSEGWVYRIKPANWLWDVQTLLFSTAYKDWIKSEYSRLKDFLATFVKPQNLVYEQIVLQDGGEMKDHILSHLGPEAWEDFQENFIDTSK